VDKQSKNSQVVNTLDIFYNKDGIILEDFYGKATAILGVRGSGKTNTAAVIVEELLSKGVPVIVLDIDGEYWTLRESYDILIISPDDRADIQLNINDKLQATRLARALIEAYVPAVIDLSEYGVNEYNDYLVAFLEEIWKTSRKYRRPLILVVEEAHEFIPQGHTNPVKRTLVRIALRGRKRGLGLIMISQRSAKVDKDVLSQAEYYILHRVMHPADLRVYKELLPMNPREIEQKVPKLKVGEALFYDGYNIVNVKVRKRRTFHVGYTPKARATKDFKLRRLDSKLLSHIMTLIDRENPINKEKEIEGKKHSIIIDNIANVGVTQNVKDYVSNYELITTTSRKALDTIVKLILLLARATPSTIAHIYVLAKETRWVNYKHLRKVSGFKIINISELKRLERHGIIILEKRGREVFLRQNFLTNDEVINALILDALSILYYERVKPILESRRRKQVSDSVPLIKSSLQEDLVDTI